MAKILLLDLDGIVIRPRHKYFSEKYAEEHGVSLEAITPFFKGEYKDAARGKISIRSVLPTYLSKWGWEGDIDSFLAYWFEGERTIDVNVLEYVKGVREKGTKVYLVSDNEEERANYVMRKLGLDKEFDGAFFSYQLGCVKSEPEFFQKIADKLKINSGDVDYWDDDPKNTDVAKKAGFNAHVYTSFEEFSNNLI